MKGARIPIVLGSVVLAGCTFLAPYDDLQGGSSTKSSQTNGANDASIDGTCTSDPCDPATTDGGSSAQAETLFTAEGLRGLAVRNGELFWVTTDPAGVWRARPGEQPTRIDGLTDAVDDPFDVDATDAYVYWSELTGNRVRKKPVDGSAASTVANGSGRCAYLVVVGGVTFVSDNFTSVSTQGSIVADGTVLYANQQRTTGIATDGSSLFWARHAATDFEIVEGTADGSTSLVEAEGVQVPSGVAADADYVYAVSLGQRIVRKVRHKKSAAEVVYTSSTPFGAGDVAVDATSIYWTEPTTGRIRRLAKPGAP